HLSSNCCKKGQTLLQRTCHGVSCCGQWCQTTHSILGKGEGWLAWALSPEATHGTWLLACTCICTCVHSGVSVSGDGRGPRAGNFTCLTNNILRIDCYWSVPELGQGSRPGLLFTRLLAAHTSASCRACCRLRQCSCHPTISSSLSTTACLGGSRSAWWTCSTCPGDTVNKHVNSGHCILICSISPALEPMSLFSRAQHRDHIVGVTWLILEAFELDPGFILEARLRVRMATLEGDVAEEERYTGQWSEWSQPVCFQAPQRQRPLIPPWGWPGNTFVTVSVFFLLTGLTYLLFKLSPRLAWGPTEPVCC
uniref:Interleukin 9 receptor n=1 Tax=Rhinopithecus roxellana TaxID=61622 RepID=A0A2K6QE95_RHIRO